MFLKGMVIYQMVNGSNGQGSIDFPISNKNETMNEEESSGI